MLVLADIKDRANFNSLLKILAILAIKLQGGRIKPLKEDIGDSNRTAALAFLKKYSIDQKKFNSMYNNILKKSSDVQPFAEPFVKDLRAAINSNRLKHDLDIISTDSRSVMEPILTLLGNPGSDNALSLLNRRIGLLKEPEITKKFSQVYAEMASTLQQQQDAVPTKVNRTTKPKAIADQESANDDEIQKSANSIDEVTDQILSTLKTITGRKGAISVSAEEKAKAEKDPKKAEALKNLVVLRKRLSDLKLLTIRGIVAKAPNNIMSTEDLTKALVKSGIKKLNIPPAFQNSDTIFVNLNGQYCDSEGRVAKRQGWQPDAEIIVNHSYSHDAPKKNWLFLVQTFTKEGKITKNYVGTEDKIAEKRAERFANVDNVLKSDIDAVKRKWRNAMGGDPKDEKTVYAFIAEFVYQTTSRIGARDGESAGSRTYGASNFLVKHVDLKSATDTRLNITYPIKAGKLEKFVLLASAQVLGGASEVRYVKNLIKFIKEKCKGKKPDDIVFTVGNDNGRVSSTRFNSYLNSIDLPFTAKTFRTMRGTELAIEALEQAKDEYDRLAKDSKRALPAKTVNDLFKAAVTNVGELLGHVRRNRSGDEESTANTAIKSYIDPKVMLAWYKSVGYAPISSVTQAAKDAGITV